MTDSLIRPSRSLQAAAPTATAPTGDPHAAKAVRHYRLPQGGSGNGNDNAPRLGDRLACRIAALREKLAAFARIPLYHPPTMLDTTLLLSLRSRPSLDNLASLTPVLPPGGTTGIQKALGRFEAVSRARKEDIGADAQCMLSCIEGRPAAPLSPKHRRAGALIQFGEGSGRKRGEFHRRKNQVIGCWIGWSAIVEEKRKGFVLQPL
ncbi:hypothetical protein QBC47DRAFT_385826 [Echria macrotheca]|uniref:Uncharacterized protein n=1 Tax=Echria macrotheca TaxID=438768 RepID=A0AAJ0BAA1_9PEZI|nr:hypothetical protein QBC47DRAFT_385826 [Echria macrotheca]